MVSWKIYQKYRAFIRKALGGTWFRPISLVQTTALLIVELHRCVHVIMLGTTEILEPYISHLTRTRRRTGGGRAAEDPWDKAAAVERI